MLERSPHRHGEDAIPQACPDAHSNRGHCVLQRLKRDDNNFQSSKGTQVDGRAYQGSPRALDYQWHEHPPVHAHVFWGARHVIHLTSGPALDASVLV
jgi:hypothetical protein